MTLIGDDTTGVAAVEHAVSDLCSGRTARAMVLAFDRVRAGAELAAVVLVVDQVTDATSVDVVASSGNATAGLHAAVAALTG